MLSASQGSALEVPTLAHLAYVKTASDNLARAQAELAKRQQH